MGPQKPPTKEESERISISKQAGCLACWQNGVGPILAEYHHCLSGNKRRGHRWGYALCTGHHRGVFDIPYEQWKDENGPSLARESKLFRSTFGTDDELIEMQDILVAKWREYDNTY